MREKRPTFFYLKQFQKVSCLSLSESRKNEPDYNVQNSLKNLWIRLVSLVRDKLNHSCTQFLTRDPRPFTQHNGSTKLLIHKKINRLSTTLGATNKQQQQPSLIFNLTIVSSLFQESASGAASRLLNDTGLS